MIAIRRPGPAEIPKHSFDFTFYLMRRRDIMPPKKSKSKALKGPPTPNSTRFDPGNPPQPFSRPAPKLNDFLLTLSKEHVYITHVDSKPANFKKKIFLVPVVMNVAIILGILYRIKAIGPFYLNICLSLLGRQNEATIDTQNTPPKELIYELLRRLAIFMIDFVLYMFILSWPREFFTGRKIGNPVSWRLAVGFTDKEIIVRRNKKWHDPLANVLDEDSAATQLLFSTVRKAVDPIWMNEKTGYLMLNSEWDLDWNSMVQASKLVTKKELSLDDFKINIFIHNKDFGWMSYDTISTENATEEEGRRKIVAFKEELTAIGQENLFFRWIELVQYESTKPGGFGPERQQATMAKAKEMFQARGVDFDKFWAKIGGMKGMPGMDEV
jgi:hypothetical protein